MKKMPDAQKAGLIMMKTLNVSMALAIALALAAFWISGAFEQTYP